MAPTARLFSLVSAHASLGLLYAALLERSAGVLADFESAELDGTTRALVWVVPPMAALVGWQVARTIDRDGDGESATSWRPLRALGWTLGAGVVAGLLASAAVVVRGLATAGGADGSGAVAGLGYLTAGAAAGLAAALPAVPVVIALRQLATRPSWQVASAMGVTLVALLGAMAVIALRTHPVPPTMALEKRPAPDPGKTRGAGPPDESPVRKRTRRATGLLDELADACKKEQPDEVERVILEAKAFEVTGDVFRAMIETGTYDAVEGMLRLLPLESPALAALVEARPDYGVDTLNSDALRSIRERKDWKNTPYAVLIVPGYTPVKARKPLALDEIDAAVKRLKLAAEDMKRGLAPYILVSGGSVHPAGTPHNEALSMRDWLIRQGVEAERILVDPFARHSTTNLRNAGRMMHDLGMSKALIVTGFEASPFDQAFYFAHPVISSFETRSRRELGYAVGELSGLDDHHIAFVPSREVTRKNPHDPLDW